MHNIIVHVVYTIPNHVDISYLGRDLFMFTWILIGVIWGNLKLPDFMMQVTMDIPAGTQAHNKMEITCISLFIVIYRVKIYLCDTHIEIEPISDAGF